MSPSDSVKLHLRDGQTDERTNERTDRPEIEFGAFWPLTSGGNNFNDFPDNQLSKFRVFIG